MIFGEIRMKIERIMLRETSKSQEKRYHVHFPSKEEEKTTKNKSGGYFFLRKWNGKGVEEKKTERQSRDEYDQSYVHIWKCYSKSLYIK